MWLGRLCTVFSLLFVDDYHFTWNNKPHWNHASLNTEWVSGPDYLKQLSYFTQHHTPSFLCQLIFQNVTSRKWLTSPCLMKTWIPCWKTSYLDKPYLTYEWRIEHLLILVRKGMFSLSLHKTAEHTNKEWTQRHFLLITETSFFVVSDYRNILQHLVTKRSFFRAKFSSPSLLPPKNITQSES